MARLVAARHLHVGQLGRLLALLEPLGAGAPAVVHQVAPQRVDGAVVDDAQHPGAHAAAVGAVAQPAAPDRQERLLRDVLGGDTVADHPVGERERRARSGGRRGPRRRAGRRPATRVITSSSARLRIRFRLPTCQFLRRSSPIGSAIMPAPLGEGAPRAGLRAARRPRPGGRRGARLLLQRQLRHRRRDRARGRARDPRRQRLAQPRPHLHRRARTGLRRLLLRQPGLRAGVRGDLPGGRDPRLRGGRRRGDREPRPREHRGQRPAPGDRPGGPAGVRHHARDAAADDASSPPRANARGAGAGPSPRRAPRGAARAGRPPAFAPGGRAPGSSPPAAAPPTTTAAAGRYQLRGSRIEESSQSASSPAAAPVRSDRRRSRRSDITPEGSTGTRALRRSRSTSLISVLVPLAAREL